MLALEPHEAAGRFFSEPEIGIQPYSEKVLFLFQVMD
jgi:hypothetical protein